MTILRAAVLALAVFSLSDAALADPIGTWLTEGGKSRVKVVD